MSLHQQYPFSAIVGQQGMKTALLLNAVDPSIGGVLIRGQKGTAKSTAARALAALLPQLEVVTDCPYHCPPDDPGAMHDDCRQRLLQGEKLSTRLLPPPMVELPLGATEDRVAGTLHLEKTLHSGQRHFEPGLLAAANRGILYVDEVNLLEDHLVDLLLDAAASGVNRVEREGLCVVHPARFMLVGTMNPEEGELRPQFLDRFGLSVSVSGLTDAHARRQMLKNRLRYEADPEAFIHSQAQQEDFLAQQIVAARQHLGAVRIPDAIYGQVVDLVLQLKVAGHRAEITLLKAARAHAALLEKETVEQQDIMEAAVFALPHRLPGRTYPETGFLENSLKDAFAAAAAEDSAQETEGEEVATGADACDFEFPGAAAAGSMLFETFKKKARNATSSQGRISTSRP